MFVEVLLGMAHFRFVDEAGMTYAAVGEFVDYRAPYPHRQIIVDERADDGAGCGKDHYHHYVDVTLGACEICGGWYDYF